MNARRPGEERKGNDSRGVSVRGRPFLERDRDLESRAASELAGRFRLAAVTLGDVPNDGEAQARAARLARASRIHAVKALEEARQMLAGNAGTGIGDGEDGAAVSNPQLRRHGAVRRVAD